MKNRSMLIFVVLTAFIFGGQTASAQITINIPKLPKIKKDKPQPQPSPDASPANDNGQSDNRSGEDQSNRNQTADDKPVAPPDKCLESGGWIMAHLDHIAQQQKDVDEYTPADSSSLVSNPTNDNYLLYAVSPKAREGWLKGANALDLKDCPKMAAAFDKLAAATAKKLPTYKADLLDYKFHNPAEEKLMRTAFENPAAYKIFSVGLAQSNWLIDKNDYGLPTARFKRGAFYLRIPTDDHPYCYLFYVNVIQDYAGGGTYGASHARYIRDELVGCPAGQ